MDPASAAGLYGFFSRLFVREVDPPFAEALLGDAGRALLPRFADSEEARRLADGGGRSTELDEDFVHLTVVDLTPYASFYLRQDGRIEAGLDNALVAFYREYGFEADLVAARAVSPDHLGVALELASRLCAEEAHAAAQQDAGYAPRVREVRRRLLAEHLLPWAPIYLLAVQRNAWTLLYREGAEVLLVWLLQDHEALVSDPRALDPADRRALDPADRRELHPADRRELDPADRRELHPGGSARSADDRGPAAPAGGREGGTC